MNVLAIMISIIIGYAAIATSAPTPAPRPADDRATAPDLNGRSYQSYCESLPPGRCEVLDYAGPSSSAGGTDKIIVKYCYRKQFNVLETVPSAVGTNGEPARSGPVSSAQFCAIATKS